MAHYLSRYTCVSQPSFPYNNYNYNIYILIFTYLSKWKQTNVARRSAWRILQYSQLLTTNPRNNSRDISNFSWYFKILTYLFHYFLRIPVREHWVRHWLLTAEPWVQSQVTLCDVLFMLTQWYSTSFQCELLCLTLLFTILSFHHIRLSQRPEVCNNPAQAPHKHIITFSPLHCISPIAQWEMTNVGERIIENSVHICIVAKKCFFF